MSLECVRNLSIMTVREKLLLRWITSIQCFFGFCLCLLRFYEFAMKHETQKRDAHTIYTKLVWDANCGVCKSVSTWNFIHEATPNPQDEFLMRFYAFENEQNEKFMMKENCVLCCEWREFIICFRSKYFHQLPLFSFLFYLQVLKLKYKTHLKTYTGFELSL